ncbi:MAG: hypothetical protein HYT21_02050 [Candidatus Nealsonbacteria bacterium]|nr:hypothetical protein [Candidatus Nealsonbacteria bacterium]
MNAADLPKIKEIIDAFFKKTGLPVEVEVKDLSDSIIPVKVKTEDAQLLIGERGQTLFEVQNLIKLMIRKQLGAQETFFVDMDINDYKQKKAEYLKEMARLAADDVVLTKKEKELMPMSAYERRIVHMALAERSDIIGESLGEGAQRRIIIRQA